MYKIVITDCSYPDLSIEESILSEINAELFRADCRSDDQVIDVAKDADGLLVQSAPITRKVIEGLERCKIISRYGVGVDNIDLDAAEEKGIVVANVRDYCIEEVANHAFAMLLAFARKLLVLDASVRGERWDWTMARPIMPLDGQTLGIVGLGSIGRAVAAKAKAFGLKTIAYDPWLESQGVIVPDVPFVSFDQLLQSSDYITIHCPLTEQTRQMFNAAALRKIKPGAYVINTARGAIIDEEALVTALREGWIAGAGLDVFENEPLPADHPLKGFPNVILTPHTAWYSERSLKLLRELAAKNIVDFFKSRRSL